MANKPVIRFTKYFDEWEEKYLGECFSERDERSADGELISVTINQGVVRAKDLDRLDSSSNDKSNYKVVCKGDLAYNTMRMWQGAEGHSSYDGILSPAYTVCKPNNDVHTQFFSYMFKKNHIIHQFKINSQGLTSDTWNLKFNNFSLIKVRVPNIEEQKEIAIFIKNINNLINSTQKKLEKAIILKKSMLEKMFPKDKEKIPELRFKGFSGEWEEKYLGECFSERDERSADGELISVTINQGVVRAKDLDRLDKSSNDKSNYKVVCKGDLAYNTMRMWQGAEGYSPYDGILSPAYTVCKPNNDVHTQFFSYLFKKNHIIHQFKINSQGLTSDTWNLKFNNFSLIKVRVPNIEEQKTIANYFENTDKMISSYNDELEKLKTIKKSLLEKMFV